MSLTLSELSSLAFPFQSPWPLDEVTVLCLSDCFTVVTVEVEVTVPVAPVRSLAKTESLLRWLRSDAELGMVYMNVWSARKS